MNKMEKTKLEKALSIYLREVHKICKNGDFREESFYPSLKNLVEKCSKLFPVQVGTDVLVLPKKTEVGIPDFRVGKNGEIVGYIEAKTLNSNLKEIEVSEQIERYRNSLPNLLLTNFTEFSLYRYGRLVSNAEVIRQVNLQKLKYAPTPQKLDIFRELLETFFSFSIPKIQKSSELSIELAKRTVFLEQILEDELTRKNEEVTRFHKAFQEELIETLTEERFADLYAQTITYGLFSARMRVQNGFKSEIAWKFIPESLPLLRQIFHSMTGPDFPESLIWIVDEITQTLVKADIKSILKEFKTTQWEEDPIIQFYETFLSTYNPEERQRMGVYYTPVPVVAYIVESVNELLKEKFGKAEGLATNDVTLLDPAAGTLTFVVQAIKRVQNELQKTRKEGLIKSYIEEHILPHFHAFEILVAPYTVGHFKVSMVLEEMGYRFKEGKRFQFYLTNTLEMKEPKQISFLIDLTKEGQEAKRIKEKVPILVVLGNPPYSVSSENKSEFIEKLMDDYKEDVRDEQNIQPLSDDYIKFIRFAHWKIGQAGKGILGFITNNAYLSGVIHRGMRKKLFETFDENYILNLHGSSRIGEKTPEGSKDENVFDIQQGVAIALYVKLEKSSKKKRSYYADLWGLREEKYIYLFKNDIRTTKWQEFEPMPPYYFFVPKDFTSQAQYEKFWKVTEIFREWASGVKTNRDHFLVDFDKRTLIKRISDMVSQNLDDELFNSTYGLRNSRYWDTKREREKVRNNPNYENQFFPYLYRPFDLRWIYYQPNLIEIGRGGASKNLMRHFVEGDNLGLGIKRSRYLKVFEFKHAFVTKTISDINLFGDQSLFFPLYLYPEELKGELFLKEKYKKERVSNFTSEFMQAIKGHLAQEPTAEEIFYFIYAILYSPAFRKQYGEFLKIDFPRVPLPSSNKIFKELSYQGEELIKLHMLEHSSLDNPEIGFPKSGSNKVEKVTYDERNQKVFINREQYFEGISKEVWENRIGAYQVIEKYLKDRKDRKLPLNEINHYMKVAKAIKSTIQLQEKIDDIYRNVELV